MAIVYTKTKTATGEGAVVCDEFIFVLPNGLRKWRRPERGEAIRRNAV
ncbi:MAG: hypothetical protein HZB17_02510 [Chloroflexi bacterium]|nr:hypothetical protein [Chloroflexota bacterium]